MRSSRGSRPLRWWDWDEERIRRSIPAIQAGDVDAMEGMA